ncbi:unnamed protein product [Tilletia laevis]|uniref:Uncharacterized protein n=3 Tax=Tilletia TaxID=13289 RepID=A0A8X7N0W1_9BASI|nr:hypothetical protein CF328_g601 [Tilletia controversa]KAE8208562.1 hypothetical protein CF335_g329 [Tilletia laevis]CAD6927214.1 unnamed protein product [Tilletia caries]KAE8254872.1 hypothetical protein A4X06_0g692 [Tilletia controversa]CAD6899801.1 unnamed protein product [Tilletia controversa]
MFARRSTHKRRRSALRADKSRAQRSLLGSGGSRSVLDVAFVASPSSDIAKGKGKESGSEVADLRCLKAIGRHVFTHSLDVVLPLPNLTADQASASQEDLLKALLARDQALAALIRQLSGRGEKQTSSRPSSSSNRSQIQNTFYHAKVPLALFLSPEFVTGFIRNGTLIALSMTSHPDGSSEDIIALDGQGILTLSLTRETYQTLGLVGRESRFHRGPSGRYGDRSSGDVQRYIVELPLRDQSFVPGKKGYERALACLKAWDWDRASRAAVDQSSLLELGGGRTRLAPTSIGAGLDSSGTGAVESRAANPTWDILFAWTPPNFAGTTDSDLPSTHGVIHFPQHLVRAEDVRKLSASPSTTVLPDVWVPSVCHPVSSDVSALTDKQRETAHRAEPTLIPTLVGRSRNGGMEEIQEVVYGLSEWAGLACLHSESIRTFSRPDPLVSSINVPTPRWSGSILHLSWRGFLAPSFCTSIVKHMQIYLDACSAGQQQRGHGKGEGCDLQNICAQSYEAPTDGPWASVCADGFEHAPLSWSSSHPGQGTALGSGLVLESAAAKRRVIAGAKLPSSGASPNSQEDGEEKGSSSAASEDESSSDSPDDDEDEDLDEEADTKKETRARGGASSAPAVNNKNAKNRERLKRKRRGHLRQGETEHGRGRSGWTCFLLGRTTHAAAATLHPKGRNGEAATSSGGDVMFAHVPRYVLLEDCGADTRQ